MEEVINEVDRTLLYGRIPSIENDFQEGHPMNKADIIMELINEAKPNVAVVFFGSKPRLIGTLPAAESAESVKTLVDVMLLSQQLSATYVSIATCHDARFVAAHG